MSQILNTSINYINDPAFVHAPILLYPSPSETFILLIPYFILVASDYRIAPLAKSCNNISPEVDEEAIISSLFIHPIDVTAPEWPFSLCNSCFYLVVDFISHTLTVLFTEPAPIYLDFGENKQQLIDDGYYWEL